jgi:hypothetical protein
LIAAADSDGIAKFLISVMNEYPYHNSFLELSNHLIGAERDFRMPSRSSYMPPTLHLRLDCWPRNVCWIFVTEQMMHCGNG